MNRTSRPGDHQYEEGLCKLGYSCILVINAMRIILLAVLMLFAYPTRLFAQKFFSQDNPLFAIAENNKVGYIDKVGNEVREFSR